MKKKFIKWLNYQFPATKGNLEILPKIEELLESHEKLIKEECAKVAEKVYEDPNWDAQFTNAGNHIAQVIRNLV